MASSFVLALLLYEVCVPLFSLATPVVKKKRLIQFLLQQCEEKQQKNGF